MINIEMLIRGKGILQYLSNLYSLTGRAGGSPNGFLEPVKSAVRGLGI
jgi:hypothetical protein